MWILTAKNNSKNNCKVQQEKASNDRKWNESKGQHKNRSRKNISYEEQKERTTKEQQQRITVKYDRKGRQRIVKGYDNSKNGKNSKL